MQRSNSISVQKLLLVCAIFVASLVICWLILNFFVHGSVIPRSKSYLLRELTSPDWRARQKAVESLSRLGDQDIGDFLAEALDDDHVEVRQLVAQRLERYTDSKAKAFVTKAIELMPKCAEINLAP